MKMHYILYMEILMSVCFINSCSKEKFNKTNHFDYGGVNYDITEALLGTDCYPLGVAFLGSVDHNFKYGVFLEVFSTTAYILDEGKYDYDSLGDATPLSLDQLDCIVYSDNEPTVKFTYVTMMVDEKKNGDFEISFEGTLSNGKELSGYYKGALNLTHDACP